MEKVFCIGLNRTGTKSFAKAMRILGRRTLPWSPNATMLYLNQKWEQLDRIIDNYDAFDDWPWPLMARELMVRLPDAKFVVTTRVSEFHWLESIKSHAKRTPNGVRLRARIFGYADPGGNEKEFLAFYRSFYSAIEAATEEVNCRDRVLSVCWESGDGWEQLCSFLGELRPAAQFPHLNASHVKVTEC
jgi:hypothetical protein